MLLNGSLSAQHVGRSNAAPLHKQFAASCRLGTGNVLRTQQQVYAAPTPSPALTVSARFADGSGRGAREEKLAERVVQVKRVTKVVKGGKQLSFRAVVVVGNEKGRVGVGCASAKEVVVAVQKAVTDAKRHMVSVPLTNASSFPHRIDGIFGAAKVMLRPASEGTGVIAGGAVRVVLELAGVKNGFGKQLGSPNALNNARATVEGLKAMKTYKQVAADRNVSVDYLMKGAAMVNS